MSAHWRALVRSGRTGDSPAWPGRQGPLREDRIRRVLRGLSVAAAEAAVAPAPGGHAEQAPGAPPPGEGAAPPAKVDGLVLVCGPETEAARVAATVRALGQAVVVAAPGVALDVFRARPARFSRVLLCGLGAVAIAEECDRLVPGIAEVLG